MALFLFQVKTGGIMAHSRLSEIKASDYPVNLGILLDQVNKIRGALAIGEGKLEQLPKGIQLDFSQCVLARALSNGWRAEVTGSEIQIYHENKEGLIDFKECFTALKRFGFKNVEYFKTRHGSGWVKLEPTKTMENFIVRFDSGHFPDLILKDE